MSDLIAIAYPDQYTAETVRETLSDLVAQHVIELEDAVVVTRDEEGKVKLHQAVQPAAKGAAGALIDIGIDDKFMKRLGRSLTPGGAALILLVRKVTPDKVLPHIQRYGGEVIQTSLNEETEARLREALLTDTAAAV
jgi:uncharacterized membrane protein